MYNSYSSVSTVPMFRSNTKQGVNARHALVYCFFMKYAEKTPHNDTVLTRNSVKIETNGKY